MPYRTILATIVAVLFVTGCGPSRQQVDDARFDAAIEKITAVRGECLQKWKRGILKTRTELHLCSRDQTLAALETFNNPDLDLHRLRIAYEGAVAKRVDAGELTPEDETLLNAEIEVRVSSEIKRRQYSERLLHQQQAATNAAILLGLGAWQASRPTYTPAPSALITCYNFGRIIQCN